MAIQYIVLPIITALLSLGSYKLAPVEFGKWAIIYLAGAISGLLPLLYLLLTYTPR